MKLSLLNDRIKLPTYIMLLKKQYENRKWAINFQLYENTVISIPSKIFFYKIWSRDVEERKHYYRRFQWRLKQQSSDEWENQPNILTSHTLTKNKAFFSIGWCRQINSSKSNLTIKIKKSSQLGSQTSILNIFSDSSFKPVFKLTLNIQQAMSLKSKVN